METKVQQTPNYVPVTRERVDYYVRSSVLGGRVVTELDSAGQKTKTHVYAGAEVVAEQDVYAGGAQGLTWKQANPVTGTEVAENSTNGVVQKKEYDPFGLELGESDPYANNSEPDYARIAGGSFYREGGNPFDGGGGCTIDRMAASCGEAQRMLGAGIAEQCRDNNCGPRVVRDTRNGKEYLAPLGRDPQTGNLGYWFRFTTQTSVTVEGKTEMYPGRPQVLWLAAAAPQNPKIEFLRDHTSNSSYGSGKEESIRSIVNGMLSDPCTKAFEDAGLTPPSKLLEKGVVIGPASLLADSSAGNLKHMGITETARKRDVGAFGSNSIKAFIVRDRSGIAFTDDGRPRIFLNSSAFGASLGDYIRHEFIHAGGAPAKPNSLGSDLYWLGWNERILSSDPRIGNSILREKVGPTESEILAACR